MHRSNRLASTSMHFENHRTRISDYQLGDASQHADAVSIKNPEFVIIDRKDVLS